MTEIVVPANPKVQESETSGLIEKAKTTSITQYGLQGLKLVVAILILISFLSYTFLNVGRIVRYHISAYPIGGETIFDIEPVRWASSNFSISKQAFFINENTDPEDIVFTFRQADLAYYVKNRIAVFTDNSYAHLFRISNAVELAAALRKSRIRYIARPPYGIAEINNSSFGVLLKSAHLTRLIFDDEGYQVFEVLSTRPNIEMKTARNVNLSNPEELTKWYATRYPLSILQSILTKPVVVSRSTNPPSVTISRKKPAFVRKNLVDVLQPWDFRYGESPDLVGGSDFEVVNGVYTFSGEIKAEGVVNLYLDLENRTMAEGVVFERKLLWSGVVNDKKTTVQGQTFILFDPAHTERLTDGDAERLTNDDGVKSDTQNTRIAKLYFSLAQGGYLTVFDLNFSKIEHKTPNNITPYENMFIALQRAYVNGWRYGFFDFSREDNVSAPYTKPLGLYGMNESSEIIVRQTTSAPVSFTSPTYIVPTQYSEENTFFKVDKTSATVKPILNISFQHSGQGGLTTQILGKCLGGELFSKSLAPASLREKPRLVEEQTSLPCIPASLRYVFILEKDKYLIHPNLDFGNIKLSSLSFSVQHWNDEQLMTDIEYLKSNDIESVNLSKGASTLNPFSDY